MNPTHKAYAYKSIKEQVWTDNELWTVQFGELKRRPGRPSKPDSLFQAFAEKLPFEALDSVKKHLQDQEISDNGVYIAHDSMGVPRYIGRGNIFNRLRDRWNQKSLELRYFSFYVITDKKHEKGIETLLIRTAGPELYFNSRKKRVDIFPGDVQDYECGSLFYERQGKRGR